MLNLLQLFMISLLLCSGIMVATWVFAKKINNYSVVDAVWAASFGALAILFALLAEGSWARKGLMLTCVGLWSLRLSFFLTTRIASHHPHEDNRYVELRKEYGNHLHRRFFWFFQYQAWSVAILSLPFLVMSLNPEPRLHPIEIFGSIAFVVSLAGEAIADAQMKRFKQEPKNRGKTCQQGLWRYSRHPNYFFESCIWWSYYLMALGSPHGDWTIFAPLTILFLLLKVTGVPLAEAQSIKSRGAEYLDYQRRTSPFIPWFPKSINKN